MATATQMLCNSNFSKIKTYPPPPPPALPTSSHPPLPPSDNQNINNRNKITRSKRPESESPESQQPAIGGSGRRSSKRRNSKKLVLKSDLTYAKSNVILNRLRAQGSFRVRLAAGGPSDEQPPPSPRPHILQQQQPQPHQQPLSPQPLAGLLAAGERRPERLAAPAQLMPAPVGPAMVATGSPVAKAYDRLQSGPASADCFASVKSASVAELEVQFDRKPTTAGSFPVDCCCPKRGRHDKCCHSAAIIMVGSTTSPAGGRSLAICSAQSAIEPLPRLSLRLSHEQYLGLIRLTSFHTQAPKQQQQQQQQQRSYTAMRESARVRHMRPARRRHGASVSSLPGAHCSRSTSSAAAPATNVGVTRGAAGHTSGAPAVVVAEEWGKSCENLARNERASEMYETEEKTESMELDIKANTCEQQQDRRRHPSAPASWPLACNYLTGATNATECLQVIRNRANNPMVKLTISPLTNYKPHVKIKQMGERIRFRFELNYQKKKKNKKKERTIVQQQRSVRVEWRDLSCDSDLRQHCMCLHHCLKSDRAISSEQQQEGQRRQTNRRPTSGGDASNQDCNYELRWRCDNGRHSACNELSVDEIMIRTTARPNSGNYKEPPRAPDLPGSVILLSALPSCCSEHSFAGPNSPLTSIPFSFHELRRRHWPTRRRHQRRASHWPSSSNHVERGWRKRPGLATTSLQLDPEPAPLTSELMIDVSGSSCFVCGRLGSKAHYSNIEQSEIAFKSEADSKAIAKFTTTTTTFTASPASVGETVRLELSVPQAASSATHHWPSQVPLGTRPTGSAIAIGSLCQKQQQRQLESRQVTGTEPANSNWTRVVTTTTSNDPAAALASDEQPNCNTSATLDHEPECETSHVSQPPPLMLARPSIGACCQKSKVVAIGGLDGRRQSQCSPLRALLIAVHPAGLELSKLPPQLIIQTANESSVTFWLQELVAADSLCLGPLVTREGGGVPSGGGRCRPHRRCVVSGLSSSYLKRRERPGEVVARLWPRPSTGSWLLAAFTLRNAARDRPSNPLLFVAMNPNMNGLVTRSAGAGQLRPLSWDSPSVATAAAAAEVSFGPDKLPLEHSKKWNSEFGSAPPGRPGLASAWFGPGRGHANDAINQMATSRRAPSEGLPPSSGGAARLVSIMELDLTQRHVAQAAPPRGGGGGGGGEIEKRSIMAARPSSWPVGRDLHFSSRKVGVGPKASQLDRARDCRHVHEELHELARRASADCANGHALSGTMRAQSLTLTDQTPRVKPTDDVFGPKTKRKILLAFGKQTHPKQKQKQQQQVHHFFNLLKRILLLILIAQLTSPPLFGLYKTTTHSLAVSCTSLGASPPDDWHDSAPYGRSREESQQVKIGDGGKFDLYSSTLTSWPPLSVNEVVNDDDDAIAGSSPYRSNRLNKRQAARNGSSPPDEELEGSLRGGPNQTNGTDYELTFARGERGEDETAAASDQLEPAVTNNASQPHRQVVPPVHETPAYKWPVLGLVGLMFIGATGNILVCMAVLRERRLQTATNYFLLSLAVADLLVCTLVMPFGIIYEFYGRWPYDWRICNLWVTCDVLTCSSSILHMCFISVGRYLGIRNPLHARQANLFVSRRAVLWRIAIAWASSALIASPITMMSLYDHKNIIPSPTECAISNKYFMIFGSLLAFFIPMFVMVPSYVMTVKLLSRRAKFVRNDSILLANQQQHQAAACSSASFMTNGADQNGPSSAVSGISVGAATGPTTSASNNNEPPGQLAHHRTASGSSSSQWESGRHSLASSQQRRRVAAAAAAVAATRQCRAGPTDQCLDEGANFRGNSRGPSAASGLPLNRRLPRRDFWTGLISGSATGVGPQGGSVAKEDSAPSPPPPSEMVAETSKANSLASSTPTTPLMIASETLETCRYIDDELDQQDEPQALPAALLRNDHCVMTTVAQLEDASKQQQQQRELELEPVATTTTKTTLDQSHNHQRHRASGPASSSPTNNAQAGHGIGLGEPNNRTGAAKEAITAPTEAALVQLDGRPGRTGPHDQVVDLGSASLLTATAAVVKCARCQHQRHQGCQRRRRPRRPSCCRRCCQRAGGGGACCSQLTAAQLTQLTQLPPTDSSHLRVAAAAAMVAPLLSKDDDQYHQLVAGRRLIEASGGAGGVGVIMHQGMANEPKAATVATNWDHSASWSSFCRECRRRCAPVGPSAKPTCWSCGRCLRAATFGKFASSERGTKATSASTSQQTVPVQHNQNQTITMAVQTKCELALVGFTKGQQANGCSLSQPAQYYMMESVERKCAQSNPRAFITTKQSNNNNNHQGRRIQADQVCLCLDASAGGDPIDGSPLGGQRPFNSSSYNQRKQHQPYSSHSPLDDIVPQVANKSAISEQHSNDNDNDIRNDNDGSPPQAAPSPTNESNSNERSSKPSELARHSPTGDMPAKSLQRAPLNRYWGQIQPQQQQQHQANRLEQTSSMATVPAPAIDDGDKLVRSQQEATNGTGESSDEQQQQTADSNGLDRGHDETYTALDELRSGERDDYARSPGSADIHRRKCNEQLSRKEQETREHEWRMVSLISHENNNNNGDDDDHKIERPTSNTGPSHGVQVSPAPAKRLRALCSTCATILAANNKQWAAVVAHDCAKMQAAASLQRLGRNNDHDEQNHQLNLSATSRATSGSTTTATDNSNSERIACPNGLDNQSSGCDDRDRQECASHKATSSSSCEASVNCVVEANNKLEIEPMGGVLCLDATAAFLDRQTAERDEAMMITATTTSKLAGLAGDSLGCTVVCMICQSAFVQPSRRSYRRQLKHNGHHHHHHHHHHHKNKHNHHNHQQQQQYHNHHHHHHHVQCLQQHAGSFRNRTSSLKHRNNNQQPRGHQTGQLFELKSILMSDNHRHSHHHHQATTTVTTGKPVPLVVAGGNFRHSSGPHSYNETTMSARAIMPHESGVRFENQSDGQEVQWGENYCDNRKRATTPMNNTGKVTIKLNSIERNDDDDDDQPGTLVQSHHDNKALVCASGCATSPPTTMTMKLLASHDDKRSNDEVHDGPTKCDTRQPSGSGQMGTSSPTSSRGAPARASSPRGEQTGQRLGQQAGPMSSSSSAAANETNRRPTTNSSLLVPRMANSSATIDIGQAGGAGQLTTSASQRASGGGDTSVTAQANTREINSDETQMIRYLGSSNQVRSEQKATKVLGVVFFTFVICWSPFFIINFTQGFVGREQLSRWISDEMMTTFLWLGYISSTINPVIYTVFNRNFRRAFRRLLLCREPVGRRPYRQSRSSDYYKSFRFSVNHHHHHHQHQHNNHNNNNNQANRQNQMSFVGGANCKQANSGNRLGSSQNSIRDNDGRKRNRGGGSSNSHKMLMLDENRTQMDVTSADNGTSQQQQQQQLAAHSRRSLRATGGHITQTFGLALRQALRNSTKLILSTSASSPPAAMVQDRQAESSRPMMDRSSSAVNVD